MDINEWLSATTASDIMVRAVVTLRPTDTLAQASWVLSRKQISGAPVVDGEGECLGVLSISDIAGAEDKAADQRASVAESSFWNLNLALPVGIYEQKLAEVRDKIGPTAEQPVENFMTSNLVSVREETPLATVAQNMVDAHIHRVIVLDANHHLLGVISTTDILAALLRSARLR